MSHTTQQPAAEGLAAPLGATYISVMDRGHPDTAQTEMARLLDECAKLGRELAMLQSAINAFAQQYREVKAWHQAPLIKALFDLSKTEISGGGARPATPKGIENGN